METQFLKLYTNVIDWCYKDEQTLYMLKRKKPNSVQLELFEIDVLVQTIKTSIEPPLFEGVDDEDTRYNILYSNIDQKLILIFPNNALVVYDSTNHELLDVIQAH